MGEFTHFDTEGNAVMVDVSGKEDTHREAVAVGSIRVNREILQAIVQKTAKKGDVLGTARIAGITGAKRTAELIPLCHPLPIHKCAIDFEINQEKCEILARCTVKTEGKTGVEMEALTGVSAALLTIYDMCKAIDKGMVLGEIHLEKKSGGKSGTFYGSGLMQEKVLHQEKGLYQEKALHQEIAVNGPDHKKRNLPARIPLRVAVITSSDMGYAGKREDLSGPAIRELVEAAGDTVVSMVLLPDERSLLSEHMAQIADSGTADLILTTGGTGFSPRDVMPEATLDIGERQVPGIPEAMRAYSMKYTPRTMLSRAASVIRGKTLIVNLPGSPKAVKECLEFIYPQLEHGIDILTGRAGNCAR